MRRELLLLSLCNRGVGRAKKRRARARGYGIASHSVCVCVVHYPKMRPINPSPPGTPAATSGYQSIKEEMDESGTGKKKKLRGW